MIYLLTLILAFCSVVYELLLGQTLSAFLGNTVLRYSVTIGLYMLSMGLGAFLVRGPLMRSPLVSLQIVEIFLAVLGGYSLALLFLIDWLGSPEILFSFVAHSLIIVIGLLTGAEIPLLIAMKSAEEPNPESKVLGIDYLGAFFGTLVFAFYFYPSLGLVPTGLVVACLNASVGLLLITRSRSVSGQAERIFQPLLLGQAIVMLVLAYSLMNAHELNDFLLNLYLER